MSGKLNGLDPDAFAESLPGGVGKVMAAGETIELA